MIIPADEDTLRRFLGLEPYEFPVKVVDEYELRLYMFHADGNSGPLGTIGIIDMLRYLHIAPPAAANRVEREVRPDWSRIPADGSVRVEVRLVHENPRCEEWLPGVYVGRIGAACAIGVRLDGQTYVDEFRAQDVRLVRAKIPALILEGIRPAKEAAPSGWDGVERGAKVRVKDGRSVKDGTFHRYQDDKVYVRLKGDGAVRSFDANQVTRAEAADSGEQPDTIAEAAAG